VTWKDKQERARERALAPSREAIRFAARCSLLRHRLHLTQRQFALELGLHWMTVSRWERIAGHTPSKRSRERFAALEHQYQITCGAADPMMKIGDGHE
jgi:DNA-binding transcriptional regulator YiaG